MAMRLRGYLERKNINFRLWCLQRERMTSHEVWSPLLFNKSTIVDLLRAKT